MASERRRPQRGDERARLGWFALLSLLVVGPALAGPAVPDRSGDAGALELVFVDPTVPDRESLLADLRVPSGSGRRFEIVVLESTRDGVRQVTETLAGHARIDAIHFVTHGAEAAVRLGGSWLNAETVAAQADALASWGRALKPDGDLLFYACDLASSGRGRALVDRIAEAAQADAAASTDRTGAESRGGNWRLEHRVGPVDTPIAVSAEEQRAWSHLLAVYTVTNTNDSGAGSLRAAIASANGTAVADTINFNIPGAGVRTINSLAPELQITRPVTIDGTTQPLYAGTPLIELNGAGAGAINGLVLTGANSSNSTIRGLAINRFTNGSRAAIRIETSSIGNAIVGNHLGTNPAGTAASANGVGVIITGTTNNRIGGTLPGERNIISGNSVDGVQIFGATTLGNLVQGNYIGLDATGLADLGNGAQGVSIWNQSDNNTVEGNVISGNSNGVAINDAGTTGNVVRGNLIGTDKDGGGPGVGNTMRGVTFDAGCTGNRVGGTAGGDGNTIAYNGSEGVWIHPTVSGITILGNSIFSNTGMGIDQSGNGFPELNDTGDLDAGGNALQNHPALSAAMTDGAGNANFAGSLHSAANTWYRVELFASSVTDATGYGEGERYLGTTNVQTNGSGNATIGVSMATVNALNALDFVTATATVCTDGAACTTYGDSSEFGGAIVAVGTLLVTTTDDTLGGNTASVSTLIAAPGGDGRISLREAITAANNTLGADTVGFGIPLTDTRHYYYQNNAGPGLGPAVLTTLADRSTPSSPVIAFDPDYPFGQPRSWYRIQPTSALPVIVSPLVLDGSRANPLSNEVGPLVEIDGTSGSTTTLDLQAGSSGSTIRGLVINRAPPPSGNAILVRSSNNVIAGNYLGTNAAGTAPGSGNGVGVRISGGASAANDNRIGGTTAADRNVLSANNLDGVMISGGAGGAANNVVQGNYIGLDVTGTQDLGNANQGIAVFGTSNTNNVIGGTAPGAGNVISGNGGDGVGIEAAGTTGTLVQANRIGTNAAGTAGVPNTGSGVRMHLSTSNNTVGGTAANAGNLIAYNNPGNTVGDGGVELRTDAGTGNSILGNSIHSNGRLGIDLNQDGVTVNDPLDGDGGPNSRLNYPDLTFARDSGGVITVAFDLDVPGPAAYRIEFFDNAAADPQAGEGQSLAGAVTIAHPGGGVQTFDAMFAGAAGDIITATTTLCTNGPCTTYGSTSEFSLAETVLPATAVGLLSFEARGVEGGVALSWQTASELRNLGFHLHRATSAGGPYARITPSLIPGLGSSPVGQSYSWLDPGLSGGVRYYYRLEDVDTASRSTLHGPVSAVAGASAEAPPEEDGGSGGSGSGGSSSSCPSWVLSAHGAVGSASLACTRHGDPDAVSLEVLSRDSRQAVVELRTGGFWAVHAAGADGESGSSDPGGTVGVYVRGLDTPTDSKALALPVRRAMVEAVVGKQVRLASAEGLDILAFRDLRPSAAGVLEMGVSRDGTVRPVRRPVAGPRVSPGYSPLEVARLSGTVFQGERKSAVVELVPVRYDGTRGQLVLARRVRVRLVFAGRELGEEGTGSLGRLDRRRPSRDGEVLAQLHTTRTGLHAVRFEEVFPARDRGIPTWLLRLQRLGEAVPFHVEPPAGVFGQGAILYFHADRTASSLDFTSEVAYELVRSAEGGEMGVALAIPRGAALLTSSTGRASFETNRIYQSGLLEAPDVWLWEALVSGAAQTKGFTLAGVDTASAASGRVAVFLQGGSESGTVVDHHVRVLVNGSDAGEASFSGSRPYRMEVTVAASLLREGANEIQVVNVGDTGVSSLVFLDRFTVEYPQRWEAKEGVFEGATGEEGTAEVGGLEGRAVVLEVTGAALAGAAGDSPAGDVPGTSGVKWLTGVVAPGGSARFHAEPGRRYLVVSGEGLLAPRVVKPEPSTLRSVESQADYLLIAPSSFLSAAEPLLVRRASQGLTTKAVSLEEIAGVFGHGRPSGEAIRSFVSYAYHGWAKPSPRYVVLLGDSTYDPQHFVAGSWASPLPALWGKTSYLWTALDPAIAAVNGEDDLPDLAIGRIPATTVEQAESLVAKLLAWEDAGQGLDGKVALVADNPDAAGDFEADVEDIRASFLGGRETTVLKMSELGAAQMRPAIQQAFDAGLGLASYVGHGGSAVWASENVWNSWDAPKLLAQSRQPLLLTMNCLNGYFAASNFESLAESLVKAEGRGAIAAFSPSGLSVDGPAHQYHRALVAELLGGGHGRLGDAILAAQRTYAETGLMPELLSVYHLFGDPATRIR